MGITSARTAYDRSGNGNHGKYWNATSTPPVVGKIGQGLEFDGVDDYVDIPSSAPLQFSGSFSSSFWIKTTGLNTTDQSLLISNDIFATTGWYTAPH
jgi:hypothetical protein